MVILKNSSNNWTFKTEVELEQFVWDNLKQLGFIPYKRQFHVNGQFYDILALDQNQNPTIIELKNSNDRYVVQQITRYYHNLKNHTLDSIHIHSLSLIRLIVIAPEFHPDNWIDRQYHNLDIEFWEFKLLEENDQKIIFSLANAADKSLILKIPISYQLEKSEMVIIPPTPRKFQKYMENLGSNQQKAILEIRSKILGFHQKIEEVSFASGFLYQSSKTATCAEFRYGMSRFQLFLWLPHPSRKKICRMEMMTRDWIFLEQLTYSVSGFRSAEHHSWWNNSQSFIKYLDDMGTDYTIQSYWKFRQNKSLAKFLLSWVDIALENWLKKITKD